jgi:monoamine oxidase
MGFAKAISKKENETVAWQKREREYLTELCKAKGIEIEILGVERDNLSLPEYKAAMREVDNLEQQAQLMEEQNRTLTEQAQELASQVDALEEKDKSNRELIEKHDLRASTLKTISKEVDKKSKKMKSVAVPVNSFFGGDEYVKIKKSDWKKITDAFNRALTRNHLLDKYEKKISGLEKKVTMLTTQVDKLKRFVASRELSDEFADFVKSLAPKTLKQKLAEKKTITESQRQLNRAVQEVAQEKKKRVQQER